MRIKFLLFTITLLIAKNGLFAQITVSGILDSSVSVRAGAGEAPAFSYGFEEYANIRMQAKLKEKAVFHGAFNVIAAAGDSAAAAEQIAGLTEGENYIAGIELERLYFQLNGEYLDLDGGLLRLPFGYGQVWGSSDFLNPKNPLAPDARPRAVLGAGLSWYPADSLKLLGFGAAPRDPSSRSGEGGLFGVSADHHWDRASVQALYSFESPKDGSNNGRHRAGLSVKADLEAGIVMDALYTYNNEAETKIDGLSFSIGADYSLFDGNLIVLAEYLYNGETSSTAFNSGENIYGWHNENYLYTAFTWRFNDFTSMTAALLSGFDDVSFTPIITLTHELFQGAALTVSAQIPLDRDLFSGNGSRGELGPLPPGSDTGRYFDCSAKLRLRF